MIGAAKHSRNKKTIQTLKRVNCPDCGKQRLLKLVQEDGTVEAVSTEIVEVRDETRYLDVCEFCSAKYQKADERFVIENMKQLRKAMKESPAAEGDSDHNDFSLNLD